MQVIYSLTNYKNAFLQRRGRGRSKRTPPPVVAEDVFDDLYRKRDYRIANALMMITRIPTPIMAIGRIPASENELVALVSSAVTVVFHAAGSARPVVVFDILPNPLPNTKHSRL